MKKPRFTPRLTLFLLTFILFFIALGASGLYAQIKINRAGTGACPYNNIQRLMLFPPYSRAEPGNKVNSLPVNGNGLQMVCDEIPE